LFPNPDDPLCGIILEPFDGVPVVAREFVVEVVVTFTKGDEGGNDVISRRVSVIEWLVTEPMGERVDAKGGLLDKEDSEDTGVDETAFPVTPAQTGDQHGEDEGHKGGTWDVVLVLPEDYRIFVEVGDVGAADTLWVLLHDHPTNVRVEEAFSDGVRVLVGIGITVVGSMATGPPSDGAFDGTGTDSGEVDLEGQCGRVGRVSPQTMIASGDTHAGVEVIDDGPDGGSELQGGEHGPIAANYRDHDDEVNVEPVNMFPPIGPGDGEFSDVRFVSHGLAARL
jgi:hypothetical protein